MDNQQRKNSYQGPFWLLSISWIRVRIIVWKGLFLLKAIEMVLWKCIKYFLVSRFFSFHNTCALNTLFFNSLNPVFLWNVNTNNFHKYCVYFSFKYHFGVWSYMVLKFYQLSHRKRNLPNYCQYLPKVTSKWENKMQSS